MIVRALFQKRSGTGQVLIVQGNNIAEDVNRTAVFVYTPLHDLLPLLPAGPYAVLVAWPMRQESDDTPMWLLGAHTAETDLDALHRRFSSRFSPGVVRSRTIPGGRTVRDVTADPEGVDETEETVDGFSVRATRHRGTGREFVSARRGNLTLLSSDRDLLLQSLHHAPGRRRFFRR